MTLRAEATTKQARRERQYEAVREEIKTVARTHMAREGAAALSLRAVATEMGLSSAALYYYYPNRDALITALIVDAFRSLANALETASEAHRAAALGERLLEVMLAYREWALAQAAEYMLVYGTPIPGYHAPTDITAPEARRPVGILAPLFHSAWQGGALRLATSEGELPAELAARATAYGQATGHEWPVEVLYVTLRAFVLAHGLVSLELFGHLQPILGDAGLVFQHEVQVMLRRLGIQV